MIASPEARVKRSLEKRPRASDFGVYCVETRRGRLKTEEKKIADRVRSMDWIYGYAPMG